MKSTQAIDGLCYKASLTEAEWEAIKQEIKMMLHASRDCLRNQGVDTTIVRFDCRDGYYGEAFGIIRTLHVLGYGDYTGAANRPEIRTNLRWWLREIEEEVLAEEGFGTTNFCSHCFKRYGKG